MAQTPHNGNMREVKNMVMRGKDNGAEKQLAARNEVLIKFWKRVHLNAPTKKEN